MSYLYENTTPERFQQFCQSLFLLEYPHLQCLPVGQPDGGRDAIDPSTDTVIQVKFKRFETDREENFGWMISVLEGELAKINNLAARGIKKYVIATNARGSAHLEVGKVDKVQKWLDENLSIPGQCLWRDDLDRRFDTVKTGFKLKYSELLSLEDGLDIFAVNLAGSANANRRNAVRAFIATQFEDDENVKFKQVSLKNNLLALFVDVPIKLSNSFVESLGVDGRGSLPLRERSSFVSSRMGSILLTAAFEERSYPAGEGGNWHRRTAIGAAELLLSGMMQDSFPFIILEGAPGQGKSTIAQYVCQLHRIKYLNKFDELTRIPQGHRQTAFRLPIKIDLRDYAAFLDGNSPFESSASAQVAPRSLEVFLSRYITQKSGGVDFGVEDVQAVLQEMPSLLFLDGLDEVADVDLRETLVTSVGEAMNRLTEIGSDLQVVITTRPSVFGKAPSFGKFGFHIFILDAIDRQRVEQYAEKWVIARGLDEVEKSELKSILDAKLALSHIRSLTTNPMQLTILLSLIHQIGYSLPDQRTDLYRRYLDLFLTREADKSVEVREYRHLLIGFIEYLAWTLQVQSESSRTSGSVSSEDLLGMAREYLQRGKYDLRAADNLFHGGLERIFVLVERITGQYEFEVQPLREYFCAQYLYSTAPVGTYRDTILRGDRAQRFEAIAQNPYWMNVTRFYAGSYASGEIGALVLSLEEMISSDDVAVSVHSRRVSLALLQDWVFSNKKYPQERLIRATFDEIGRRILLDGTSANTGDLRLEPECGRELLKEILFDSLIGSLQGNHATVCCRALRVNDGGSLQGRFMSLVASSVGAERTRLVDYMFRSGAGQELSGAQVWEIVNADSPPRRDLLQRCGVVIEEEPTIAGQCSLLLDSYISGVMDGLVYRNQTPLSAFGYFVLLMQLGDVEIINIIHGRSRIGGEDDWAASLISGVLKEFLPAMASMDLERNCPESWGKFCELVDEYFGPRWATRLLAISAAGISTSQRVPNGVNSLFDGDGDLYFRARYARLWRGGLGWWERQIRNATSDLDKMFWAGLVVLWSSAANLYGLADSLNEVVGALSDDQYRALLSGVTRVSDRRKQRSDRKKLKDLDLSKFSSRVAVLVHRAFGRRGPRATNWETMSPTPGLSDFLTSDWLRLEFEELPESSDVSAVLDWLERLYKLRVQGTDLPIWTLRNMLDARIPSLLAVKVVGGGVDVPNEVISSSVNVLERQYRAAKLGSISIEQEWSFE